MNNVKTARTTRLEYPRYYNPETDKYYRRYDEKSDMYDIEIKFRDRKNIRWYGADEEIPHFSKLHTLKTRLKHRIRRIIYSIIP